MKVVILQTKLQILLVALITLGNKDFGARDISTDSVTFRVTDNYMINTFSQSGQNFQQF